MAGNDDDVEDDVNDASDMNDDGQESGVFRWMSVVVVLMAVAGFFGLAWYAYKSGGDVTDEKEAELIQADNTPVKEAPANPGGMPIPNQDKTVYGLVGGKTDEGKVAEHILASPETPVARNNDEPETGTWMSDQVKNKVKAEEGKNAGLPSTALAPVEKLTGDKTESDKPAADTASGEKPADNPAPKAEQFKPVKSPDAKDPIEAAEALDAQKAKTAETKVADAAKPANTTTGEMAKMPEQEDKSDGNDDSTETAPLPPVDKKPAPAAKPVPAADATPPAGARAQLGAYKSTAEADDEWNKISKRFSSFLSGKDHYVIRADLGSKGIFYRLQVAPFSSSRDVEKFCLGLVSDGQGCFLARGK